MFLVFPSVLGLAVIKNKIQPESENEDHAHNSEETQRNIEAGQYRQNRQKQEHRNGENSGGLPP
jgi:hypothetical protein